MKKRISLRFSRFTSFLIIFFVYAFSFCSAALITFLTANYLPAGIWLLCFEFGIILTIFVFIFSSIFKNASVYDPFWSVYPMMLLFIWFLLKEDIFENNVLLSLAIVTWSIRLTLNWARGWKGMQQEDWRYIQLRNENGKLYPLVNFFGIHLFPTLLVSLAMLPAYYIFFSSNNNSPEEIIPFMICLIAVALELVADEQQRIFRRTRKNQTDFIQTGIWKYSRHPNYFGEVLFWWGIYSFVIVINPSYWWTIAGAIAMTCLFIFISIPLMEKHMLAKNSDYENYQQKVSALIPWLS